MLSETDLLGKAFGPGARRLARALQREAQTLPPAALAIVDTFRERRRREDRIGTWYADE